MAAATKRLRLLRYGIFFLFLSWLGVHGVLRVGIGGGQLLQLCLQCGDLLLFRSGSLRRSILHPLRDREDRGVDLRVEVEERLLRGRIEPGERQLDGLLLVAKDGERLAHFLQAASGDDVIQATLLEAHADRFRPLGEVLGELLVLLAVCLHLADDDTRFDGAIRVVLFEPVGEAVKERLVHAARTHEPIRLTLALGVGRGDHIEADSGFDEHTDLLDVDALALKHGLKAHHALRPKVNLVKEEDGATLHGLNHAAEHELRFAVDEAEATDEVILVSLGGDVDADALASGRGANLLHHRGLAVAGHTRDVDGSELLGGEDGGDVIVVTPRNESLVLDGDERNIGGRHDEVVGVAVHVADCITFGGVRGELIGRFFNIFFRVIGHGAEVYGDHLRDGILATGYTAALVLHQPSRQSLVVVDVAHSQGRSKGEQALLTGVYGLTDGLWVSIQNGEGDEKLLLAIVDCVHTGSISQVWECVKYCLQSFSIFFPGPITSRPLLS